jgi:hypothetical protein
VSINVCDEAGVVYGIKGNINFLFEVISVSEGGKMVRVGYEGRRSGSRKRGSF